MTATDHSIDKPSQIAGFWRRLFAFVLDGMVLGILGGCLGYFLFDYLVTIGGWGRTIGFSIALAYFGVMSGLVVQIVRFLASMLR